ncbi:MAG: M48 family metallopeptidase [bacterium]
MRKNILKHFNVCLSMSSLGGNSFSLNDGISLQQWLDRDEKVNNVQTKNKMTVQKKMTLFSEKIEYTVRKHRTAKRLKLVISCDGNCTVTLPWRMGFVSADEFIRKNAAWVLEKMKAMKKIGKNSLFARHDQVEYTKLKEHAREMVTRRLEKYAEFYGFKYGSVAIRNQKTRWGSCSSKGNLNFNYKILLLPQRHADYIIVHELCHLKEFNHSKRFWSLVAQTFPDYEKIVSQLKLL